MAINQFQLILLLLLANSGIPYKIVDFLTGMKDTTCSFNFIPFKDIPGINTMIQKLDFPLNNNNLKPFGLISGSIFVNNFSFICIVVILIAIEGIFLIIYFICKPKTSLESKSRKILTQLYQLFFISIYIRLVMETSQFIVICAVNDIYSSQTSNFKLLFSFITSILFFLLALFLILVGFIEWCRFKTGFDDNHHIYFKEYFNGIRNNSVVRIYTSLVLTRRVLIVTFLITCSSLSSIYLMQVVALIQFIYLLGIIVLRPFQEIRNNLIEIVNEVYFFVMVIYISNYSTSDRWTDTAVDIFLYLIVTNSLIIIVILLIGNTIALIIRCAKKKNASKIKAKEIPNTEKINQSQLDLNSKINQSMIEETKRKSSIQEKSDARFENIVNFWDIDRRTKDNHDFAYTQNKAEIMRRQFYSRKIYLRSPPDSQ